MFAIASRRVINLVAKKQTTSFAVRAFSTVNNSDDVVPSVEGLAGIARKQAVVKAAFNEDLFDRIPLAFYEEGSRENPIIIHSTEEERIVGLSLPDDAEVRWFTLRKGELIYDPDTNNYLALRVVPASVAEARVAEAEKKLFG